MADEACTATDRASAQRFGLQLLLHIVVAPLYPADRQRSRSDYNSPDGGSKKAKQSKAKAPRRKKKTKPLANAEATALISSPRGVRGR
jgi:hypothetical protein